MAYYYESNDSVKGMILDELAREFIAEWENKEKEGAGKQSTTYLDAVKKAQEGAMDMKLRGKVQNRIASYFPSIERMLPVTSDELAASPKRRDQFKQAAKRMYLFLNNLFAPASLIDAIADTPPVRGKSKRFKEMFENIHSTAKNTALDAQLLYPALEELVRATNSFEDLETVVSRYNAFFSDAGKIPGYTRAVTGLVDTGWGTAVIADVVKATYLLSGSEGYLPSLRHLITSMKRRDVKTLMDEIGMLTEQDMKAIAKGTTEQQGMKVVDGGKRKLGLLNLDQRESRFGLFLGLAGLLGVKYEFNPTASSAKVSSSKRVGEGTSLVFNDGENRISLELVAGLPPMTLDGIALEELQEYVLSLDEPGTFVAAVYSAIDMLAGLPHGKKHLDTGESTLPKSSVKSSSSGMSCTLRGIDLEQRTVRSINVTVKSEDKARLYEELLKLAPSTQFGFLPTKTSDGVEVEMDLSKVEMAATTESLQAILTTLDNYTSFGSETSQCSLMDVLAYVNQHADKDKVPAILSKGAGLLRRIGALFVYPQTFERNFERLHRVEQESAVEVLYALEPAKELAGARQWLSENYKDLIVEKGLGA